MNGSKDILQVMRLLAVTLLMVSHFAHAQEDLSKLTEAQILDQVHRKDYREEFFRRLEKYSPVEREAAMQKFRDSSDRRQFPQEFGGDELLELVLTSDDADPAHKAIQEIKRRYADASPEEHAALAELLHAEYRAAPHPILLPDMSNGAEVSASLAAYLRIDRAVVELLSEESALTVFRDVYLDSGQKGAITAFVSRISRGQICGPATLATLEELRTRTAIYAREELDALGEHEAVETMVYMAIRGCSDNSFEAVKARDWQKNDLDIYAMGSFDDLEARELLSEYYDTISKAPVATKKRLDVLRALAIRWNREQDNEVRELLRRELPELLNLDHNANPYSIYEIAEVIGQTRDPYYLPLLKKRRANLDPADFQRASASPQDQVQQTVDSVKKQLDDAIAKLEEAQLARG